MSSLLKTSFSSQGPQCRRVCIYRARQGSHSACGWHALFPASTAKYLWLERTSHCHFFLFLQSLWFILAALLFIVASFLQLFWGCVFLCMATVWRTATVLLLHRGWMWLPRALLLSLRAPSGALPGCRSWCSPFSPLLWVAPAQLCNSLHVSVFNGRIAHTV